MFIFDIICLNASFFDNFEILHVGRRSKAKRERSVSGKPYNFPVHDL